MPETLAEMDSAGSEFQQNAAELRAMGKQRLSLQERKRRRRALDALGVPDFAAFLGQQGVSLPLRKEAVTMLQLNVGLLCNQACTHCHVESSPRRTEAMDERLVEHILRVLAASPEVETVDITGGAPEMTPAFWPLVRGARALGKEVRLAIPRAPLARPPLLRSLPRLACMLDLSVWGAAALSPQSRSSR